MRRTSQSSTVLLVYVSILNPYLVFIANLLDQHENPHITELTPKLIRIFASVLSDPIEQLDIGTREKIINTVKFIAEKNPGLINGNETLMNCVRG